MTTGYRLRMSGEIHDWLADLAAGDPPAALAVGQALTALIEEGAALGPPLVVSLADRARPEDLPEALDRAYQDRLDSIQLMRRRVADAATLRNDIEGQLAELESLREELGSQHEQAAAESAAIDEVAATLRRLLPGVIESVERLTRTSRWHQARTDAFRTRKETLKATYAVAQATEALQQTGAGTEAGPAPTLRDVTAEIERELGGPATADGLNELRPGAPGHRDVRLLFALEPPGTALLIAVLEGAGAVRDHYREAVLLATGVLRRVRADQAPEAAAHAYADAAAFLGEFFPGRAEEVAAGADALAERNRAHALAQQRSQLGLTQDQVARRMGVPPERVAAIERAQPGATDIRTLAAYVAALGGRLDIVADFGAEQILLR